MDEGNTDGSTQIVGSVGSTLNLQTARRRLADDGSGRMLSEGGVDRSAFREGLMDFVVQTSGTTSSDPLATKQRAGDVATLGNQPDELSEGTLEKGAGLIDGLVSTSAGVGGEMADGAGEDMLSSMGNFFKAGNEMATQARRRKRMRRLQAEEFMSEMRRLSEVNGTTDSTNSSGNATIVVTGDDNSTHIVQVDPVTNATFFLNETFTKSPSTERT